jgi:hypothetical protein
VRQKAGFVILAMVLCTGFPDLPATSVSGRASQGTLPPGFYIAPWNDDYQTRWLLLYVNRRFGPVIYDAAEVTALCTLKIRGDSVGFTTEQLPFWQTGDRFTFSFLGRRMRNGIKGVLLMNGAPYDKRVFSTEFRHYAIDTKMNATDTALEGVYASVRMHQESGDLLGEELLVVKTIQGFTAFYTDYEGVPVGPYPADTFSMRGDTADITVPEFGPDRPVSKTFILQLSAPQANSDAKTVDDSRKPTHLEKKASVQELFQPPHQCAARPLRGGQ